MRVVTVEEPVSRVRRAVGWILFGIAALFLTFDSVGKLLQLPQVVEGTTSLGYPASVIVPLYAIPLAYPIQGVRNVRPPSAGLIVTNPWAWER